LRFGYFNVVPRCAGETWRESAERNIIETQYAESLGFDDTWLGEAFLFGGITLSAGSLLSATMLAARTTRIRIGTAIVTMPLHHPLQVAISAASIDQLSGGRFDLGFGRGIFSGPQSPAGFDSMASKKMEDITPEQARSRYLESLVCVKGLLDEDVFNLQGEFYEFNDTVLSPKPYQERLPLWGVAQSAQTFAEMGERGMNLLIPMPGYHMGIQTWERTKAMLGDYRRIWKEHGHPGDPQVIIRTPTFLHDTTDKAMEIGVRTFERLNALFREVAARQGLSDPDELHPSQAIGLFGDPGLDQVQNPDIPLEDTLARATITGTPEMAVEEIQRMKDELGADGVMIEPQVFAQTEREDVLRTMRLTAEKVMPHFK